MSATNRRSFLQGLAGGAVAGGVAGAAGGFALTRTPGADPETLAGAALAAGQLPAVPFHGPHQPGVLRPAQRHCTVLAFDVTADNRPELTELFHTITSRSMFLTTGGVPPSAGIDGPPLDSGLLGPTVVPDGLTVTAAVGSTLFDDRYGLAARRPAGLTEMRTFPNDNLDPAQCGGDLLLQFAAGNADTVLHAIRDVSSRTRGAMQIKWRADGFTSPPRPAGTVSRNLMGFMDGIANPPVSEADQLIWVRDPSWTAGGSYLVVRLIRMLTEFWDRVDITEQENMFGRRRASGYPLDGDSIGAIPDYTADPSGDVIPPTSHIRLANPRTSTTAGSRILRRGYNYDRGVDQVGDLDMGLIFTCYQSDIKRQFEAVQTRLIDEPLVDYISPFGGGYFLALPGVTSASDYFGRALLT